MTIVDDLGGMLGLKRIRKTKTKTAKKKAPPKKGRRKKPR